jgi:hypothetical protein
VLCVDGDLPQRDNAGVGSMIQLANNRKATSTGVIVPGRAVTEI